MLQGLVHPCPDELWGQRAKVPQPLEIGNPNQRVVPDEFQGSFEDLQRKGECSRDMCLERPVGAAMAPRTTAAVNAEKETEQPLKQALGPWLGARNV